MAASAEMSLEETQELASAYGAAWNGHDVEALLSMQTDDMVFHLHVEGFDEVSGVDALRELYTFFFDAMPDYRADIRHSVVHEHFVAFEYTISATLAKPFPIGSEVGTPTGAKMSFEAVDLLPCAGGKVSRKDTYVDGFAMRRGLGLARDAN